MRKTLICLAALALMGCQPGSSGPPGKLTTAKLDTATILQADPEYMKDAQQYLHDQMDLKQQYFEKFKPAFKAKDEAKKKQVGEEFQVAQKKLDDEWKDRTAKFLESRHASLKEAAEKIALDQGIDMVVIDSREYPSVEYGAVDITQEVVSKLYAGSGAKTPTPQETKP